VLGVDENEKNEIFNSGNVYRPCGCLKIVPEIFDRLNVLITSLKARAIFLVKGHNGQAKMFKSRISNA